MRVLYICNLYPELELCLKTGIWDTNVVPEITHMIERLEKAPNIEPTFILTQNNPKSNLKIKGERLFPIKGFESRLWAISKNSTASLVSKLIGHKHKNLKTIVSEICKQKQPDLIYCDGHNLEVASEVAEKMQIPIVWRVNDLPQNTRGNESQEKFYRKYAKAPIHTIIGTLDGTGIEEWLMMIFGTEVDIKILPNGYNRSELRKPSGLPESDNTKVLFAGPLDETSNWKSFVKAFQTLRDQGEDKFEAIIIGDGPDLKNIKARIKESGAEEYFHILPKLIPRQMKDVYIRTDICVSLSEAGNLNNAVLAALCEGICVLLPKSDSTSGIDIETETFLPNDAAMRFGEADDHETLAEKLIELRRIHKRRKAIARNGKIFANKHIKTWQARIYEELKILEDIAETQT